MTHKDFHFGLETEYMLVNAETFAPLWHTDFTFESLNKILEAVPLDGLDSLAGLEPEPLHRRVMPYVVEGYTIPDADFRVVDLIPKGLEIRTPLATSLDACLSLFRGLYHRLHGSLLENGLRAAAISHHPTRSRFRAAQNKRQHDDWLWSMEVMTTYGPDINVSLPEDLNRRLDLVDLDAKINHYAASMVALCVGSPLLDGDLWRIRGAIGKSLRTYRRSVVAPPFEAHPDEGGRLEFKALEMSSRVEDFRNYFLLFLAVLLDDGLLGRASQQTRVYDLGEVARFGLDAPEVIARTGELLDRAPRVLERWGFASGSLSSFAARFDTKTTPADELIEVFRAGGLDAVMHHVSRFEEETATTL